MNLTPCPCLPTWMSCATKHNCAHCNGSFDLDDTMFCNSLFIPCVTEVGRVHAICLQLHEKCLEEWTHEFEETKRYLACERYPFMLEHITSELRAEIRANCLDRHKLLGGACEHCNTASQETRKLRSCSRCHNTFYCDAKCQIADWPRHKKSCASFDLNELRRPCGCFSDEERALFKSSFSNQGEYLNLYTKTCGLNAKITHTIPCKKWTNL